MIDESPAENSKRPTETSDSTKPATAGCCRAPVAGDSPKAAVLAARPGPGAIPTRRVGSSERAGPRRRPDPPRAGRSPGWAAPGGRARGGLRSRARVPPARVGESRRCARRPPQNSGRSSPSSNAAPCPRARSGGSALLAHAQEVLLAGFVLGDPLAREVTRLDLGEDLLHRGAGLLVDDPLAARQVAVLGGVEIE